MTVFRNARRFRIAAAAGLVISAAIFAPGCAAVPQGPAAQPPPSAAAAGPPPPRVINNLPVPFKLDATEAYLVDYRTGTVLYEYNADTRLQPGSLAKLMTFYLALDALSAKRVSLTSKVTIGEDTAAIAKDPTLSRMFLKLGQQVSFEDLLFGMMVHSGCDAAQAIADYIGGDSFRFVALMNAQARQLGMANTNFAKPNGLPVPGEYSSAHDMAILARALVQRHPEATTYTSRHDFGFNGVEQKNTNGLLFMDPRVKGLKTGHVREAGFHLVAFANHQDVQFISAVLGAPTDARRTLDSELLLNWAFATFTTIPRDSQTVLPN